MRARAMWVLLPVLLAMLGLSGCNSCSNSGVDQDFDLPDSLKVGSVASIDKNAVEEMVENIASPVETASLIKRLGLPFDKGLLIPSNAEDNFNTNFQKALGLGLFGTDLGYLNMYEKSSEVLTYISAVKNLADGIQVGQFFDFSSLKRLASNNENLDSLIFISQQSYNHIDTYLRDNNRASLSQVIVAGVWIEGMYLTARLAKQTNNDELVETVADQKIVIAKLIPMLRVYEGDPSIKKLADRLDVIKGLYDQVKITYEQGEPVSRVIDGKLTFEQKDKQIVDASPELMGQLIDELIKLRTEMISSPVE